MGEVAKLQRDALFKKLRAKPENKVSKVERCQGSCVSVCRLEHSGPALFSGPLRLHLPCVTGNPTSRCLCFQSAGKVAKVRCTCSILLLTKRADPDFYVDSHARRFADNLVTNGLGHL